MSSNRQKSEGLAGIDPTLHSIIEEVSGDIASWDLDDKHNALIAAAIKAYKAGVIAMAASVRHGQTPVEARRRLDFWSDILEEEYRLQADEPETADSPVDDVPSFVPFDPNKCMPNEDFYTEERREGRDHLAGMLIENFQCVDEATRKKIAAEMGFKYGRYLQANGVTGSNLVNQVKVFERKQLGIIEQSLESGSLRQSDQDEHAYEHYLQDLFRAGNSIWR